MAINQYPKYKISINPDSKKIQSLQPGDIVRRQYIDGLSTIYSLMAVLKAGEDEVINDKGNKVKSPYFIGALLEGDIPNSQQLLDFVRITNLFNADRSGALYMTASDSNAPFFQIIDKLGTEKSICLPYLPGGIVNQPSKDKYSCLGESFLTSSYSKYVEGAYRVYRVTRNNISTSDKLQIKVTFNDTFQIQDKVLISYKIRSSKELILPYSFGYTDGSSFEGSEDVPTSNDWEYKLHIIQIDSPARETRSFAIDLIGLNNNDWVEIAELNIIKLSDVANFSEAGKAIIGNINSVVDPVFGTLKGYGIHTENFYATNNVGIAGTLTAGDSDGFSSTFYAGRIYKNMIKNSLICDFNNTADVAPDIKIPAKIGLAYKFKESITLHRLTCRESDWSAQHKDEIVTFSIWIYSTSKTALNLFQNTNKIDSWEIYIGWRRYSSTFPISESGDPLYINFETNDPLIACSPQLEKGDTVSQYQPTDGVLKDDSEGYGAWFCEGGIGGTIQNPLLKLGSDGSIRSRNDDFYILPDGSAYFKGQLEIGDKSTIDGVTLIKNGKINTAVLEVRDIFSQNIETETIVGANLTFQKGTIGGWKITSDKLTSETTQGRDHIELSTTGGIQAIVANKTVWQLSPTGSGLLATGKIRWDASGNATIAGWNITDTQLFSTLTANKEQIILDSNGSIKSLTNTTVNWLLNNDGSGNLARGNVTWDTVGNLSLIGNITASGGTIGGWVINNSSIKKNSVYLGSDGSIYHTSNYWRLNNDGSGQLAGGAIKWSTDGIWNVDKITAKSGSIGAWNIDSDSIYSGSKQISNDYTYSGITLSSAGALRAKQFRIDTNGNAYFKGTLSAAGGTFSGNLSAAGGTFAGNLSAAGGTFAGNLSAAGGTFTGTLSGVNGDFSGKITASSGKIGNWVISSGGMTYNDVYLSSNGDLYCSYGGTERWRFSNNGAGHIASNKIKWDANGNITVDAAVQAKFVTAEAINALSLTTTKGTIGGWSISASAISKNNVYLGSDGSIYNGNYWRLNKDGSGQLANGNISWTTGGVLTVAGTIKASAGNIGSFQIDGGWLKCNSAVGQNIGYINMLSPKTRIAFGNDLIPATAGGASTITAIIENNNTPTSFLSGTQNTGLYVKAGGSASRKIAVDAMGNIIVRGGMGLLTFAYPANTTTFPYNEIHTRNEFYFQTSVYSSMVLPTFDQITNAWGGYSATPYGEHPGASSIYKMTVVLSKWGKAIDFRGSSSAPLNGFGGGIHDSGRYQYGTYTVQPGGVMTFYYINRNWYILKGF